MKIKMFETSEATSPMRIDTRKEHKMPHKFLLGVAI